MLAYHCDRDGCDTWQRWPSDMDVFIIAVFADEPEVHFCCVDCMMHWAAANSSPTIRVDSD